MSKRLAFRWAFLIVTGLAVGWELVASFDSSDDTEPWTELIVNYVPAWVTFSAIGVLVLWLPAHFWLRYRKRRTDGQSSASDG